MKQEFKVSMLKTKRVEKRTLFEVEPRSKLNLGSAFLSGDFSIFMIFLSFIVSFQPALN